MNNVYCEKHNSFYKDGEICIDCWRHSDKVRRNLKIYNRNEAKKERHKQAIFKTNWNTNDRQKLKNELQRLVSLYAKKIYKEKGMYFCWISERYNNNSGLTGLHASHYYAKGNIWQLWAHLPNIGLSSLKYNVFNPETVTQMRKYMTKVWGDDEINRLDELAIYYQDRINMRLDPRYPPVEWLIASIQDIKNKIKPKK